MIGLFCFVLAVLASPFKSKSRLEAENAVLRHQMYRWFPSILKVVTIVQPETVEIPIGHVREIKRLRRSGSRTAPAINHAALLRERKKYAAQKVTQK